MKKLFLMFAAVAALFATSCVTDATSDVAVTGGECDVTLSVVAPGADSRATIGTGLKATDLTCAVYDHEWKYLTTKTTTFDNGSLSTTIEMRLVKGKEYNFVFWAQAPEATCYTLNFGTTVGEKVNPNVFVNYNTDVTANDDHRDAFFGNWHCTVQGTINHTVELYRPFAQINFGTNDHLEAEEFGFDVVGNAAATTTVTTRAYNTLYLATGVVENEQDVTFAAAALPVDTTLETKNGNYHWLAMNYILWPADELSLSTCTLTVAASNHSVSVEVPGAPAKRNWRTNLVGKILTEQGNLTIEILPIPEGELPNPDDNNLVHELLLTAAVGGEITLTEDVVTPHTLVVLSDMTLDLGGKSLAIDNTTRSAQTSDPVIQVQKGAKLIVKNGTIKSEVVNGGATIYNEGTVVLMDGANIVGAPIGEVEYPSYCIRNAGNLTIEEGVTVSADRGCLFLSGEGETVINGGTLRNNDISDKRESFTSHVIVVGYGANNKLTINGGTFNHLHTKTSGGVVVNNWSAVTVDINGGDFRGGNYFGKWDNLSDYGYGSTKTPFCVKGGSFSGFDNKFLAAGYKAVLVDNLYYVLPEVVADAAIAANVTAVTESTADVATALATDNSEATLFTWNDVAYIAKYGEVVITSAAEEATTVRGIVESAAALKSATVAEGIEVVGNRTFRKCAALETVTFPNSLTEIGSAVFQSCSKLANVTIPASVTTIGEGAFADCTSLTTINIPDGVTRLEKDVLRNTGLTSIEIPASVNYIGHYAFRDCDQLTEVKILAPSFTMETDSFLNAAAPYPAMTIYVANAEMKAYVESKLGAHALTYTKVIVPNTVSTAAELQEVVSNVNNGDVIVLSENFDFTEGANGSTNGISVTGAENFVLDLNGNTVTSNLGNIVLRFKIGDGNSLTNQNVTVTIKNGKVVSGDKNWCAISAAAVNGNQITLNLENVEVESNKEGDCAVKSFSGAVINAKNVTVTSNAGGGFYASGGEIVLDNCSAICTGATSWFVPLSISSSGKMTVNSGSYTIEPVDAANGQYLAYVMNSGGELVINGGTFNGTVATDGNQSKACGLICADTGAKVTLNGGTYNSNGAILDMRNNLGNASKNPSVLLGGGDYSNDPRVSGIYGSNLITVADGKTVAQGANGRWTVE